MGSRSFALFALGLAAAVPWMAFAPPAAVADTTISPGQTFTIDDGNTTISGGTTTYNDSGPITLHSDQTLGNATLQVVPTQNADIPFGNSLFFTGSGGTAQLSFNGNDTNYVFNGPLTVSASGGQALAIATGYQGNGDRESVTFNAPIPNNADGSGLALSVSFQTQTAAQTYVNLAGVNTFSGPINLVGTSSPPGNPVSQGYLNIGGVFTHNGDNSGTGCLGSGATYAGAISLDTNTCLRFDTSASQVLSGPISGPGTVLEPGSGILTLSGDNSSHSGPVLVSGGTLVIAAGADTVPLLQVSGGVAVTGGTVTALAVNGGVVNASAAATVSGATTVTSGGSLNAAANALALSTVTVTASNCLTFAAGIGSVTFGALADNDAPAGIALQDANGAAVTLAVGANNSDSIYSSALSGPGGLTKVGSGTFTLAGNGAPKTYGGATIVNAGTLKLAAQGIAGNGLWEGFVANPNSSGGFAGFDVQNPVPHTSLQGTARFITNYGFNGTGWPGPYQTVAYDGLIDIPTAGSYTFGIDGQPNAGGDITIDGPSVVNTIGAGWANQGNATLTAGWHSIQVRLGNSEGEYGPFQGLMNTMAYGNVIMGYSTDGGDAWNAFDGSNGVQLGHYIYDGSVAGSNVLPTTTPLTVASGGTLDLDSVSQQVGSLSGAGTVINSGASSATLTVGEATLSSNSSFSGLISDASGSPITLATGGSGTFVLAGTAAIQHAVDVPTGVLTVNGALTASTLNVTLNPDGTGTGTGQLAGSGTIALTGDNLYYDSSGTSHFAGRLTSTTAAAGLEIDGGTLVLSGSDSYEGATAIDAGELVVASAKALPAHAEVVIGRGGILVFDPALGAGPLATALAVPAAVPEPPALALLATALAAAGYRVWRRKRG